MPKINYFDTLDALAKLCADSVKLALSGRKSELAAHTEERDRLVLDIENALFADFLPPLERNDISIVAHALSRVIDAAAALSTSLPHNSITQGGKDAEIYLKMADELTAHTARLRNIRKPNECPNLKGFRQLLRESRRSKKQLLGSRCALPCSAEKLCGAISQAFDDITEVMLNNI